MNIKCKMEVDVMDPQDDDVQVGTDILTVNAVFTPYQKSERDRYGVPMTPAEDATIEIEEVTDSRGYEVTLTERETERAMELLWEVVQDAYDARADYEADCREERERDDD